MRLSIVHKIFIVFCVFVLSINTVFAQDTFFAPFVGSGYFKGTVSGLGEVQVYVPINSKGCWGVSNSGALFNVSSTNISGIMYTKNGTSYTFSARGFSLPRYRLSNSSSDSYTDLYLMVNESNLDIATKFPPLVSFTESLPLITVSFLGVILFFMMRYKH